MRSWKKIPKVAIWQMRLRKLAFVLALPFSLPVMILAALVTTWPNMECVGMSNHKCQLSTDADCSNCSMYEPKEAYPLKDWSEKVTT